MQKTGIVIIALLTGLIFFSGSTASFATGSKPGASKKQSWKKPHAKKQAGVTGEQKDRQLAEIRHEEKSAGLDPIIALPALTAGSR